LIKSSSALTAIPSGLRDPLLDEYDSIVQNYMERRWTPSELSGGKFCEIVYTILQGHAKGTYPTKPAKPANFVDACKKLESNSGQPRSFQILIPRMLPCLYEIRNNRGVGHVGGDVDPNHMDALAVLSMSNWIVAELVRVLHSVSVNEAQSLVDDLVERRVPLVWQGQDVKRVLDPSMQLKDQILLLLASTTGKVAITDLLHWTDTQNKKYFLKVLRAMHKKRQVELSNDTATTHLLPPGSALVEQLVGSRIDVTSV